MPDPLTIWCNQTMPPEALDELRHGAEPHRLLISEQQTMNLGVAGEDPLLAEADIAAGQPNPEQVIKLQRLRWVHLTAAGYTRYDREDLRNVLRQRGATLTNSSMVYADPCAQHLLAFMLSMTRRLPLGMENQFKQRAWPSKKMRIESRLLNGETVVIVGFGSIARRLVELLAPFQMNIIAVRRRPRGDEPVRCVPDSQLDEVLPLADHVVNLLPASTATQELFNADRFKRMKPSAYFYNIGRGSTVDQYTLRVMLETQKLAGAYLDVTMPEPLAADDPLWSTPNCYITPHTAGGQAREFHRLVEHFLQNLRRFERGEALLDRII